MEILSEILKRKSVREFSGQAVEKEKLTRILEAGRLAPSAKNRQEWRFLVIQKPALRARLQQAAFGQDHVGEAPVVIVACTTNIGYRMPNGQLSYPVDITFACSFMMLQAVHEGLGTCCICTFDEEEIRELLSIPYSMRVVMLLLVGYGEAKTERVERKPLKSITAYNHW